MKMIINKSLMAVITAVIIISGYFIAGILIFANSQYNRINTKNLEETVRVLGEMTPASVFTDPESNKTWISQFETYSGPFRITLIRRDGTVIFDNDADNAFMESHLDRSEFQSAIIQGQGAARRQSATLGREYIYAGISINDEESRTAGVLRLSHLAPTFSSQLTASAFPFLFIGVLLILGVNAGLYAYSRLLSRSIEERQAEELETKTHQLKQRTVEAETEGRMREAILATMFDGLIALDNKLNITLVNQRLCSLFGIGNEQEYHPEKIKGMPLLEFSRSVELEAAAQEVLNTAKPCELSFKRYVSGIEQHFRAFAAPLGEAEGVVIVMGDISRLVKLEQVRKDFAANVSHELRTPIQIVKGFAENLIDSSLDNKEEIRHFASIISKNIQIMETLTNDLLTIVALEENSSSRHPREEINMAVLLAETLEMVHVVSREKNITINSSCPHDLTAKLYGPFIIQALFNLLENSIKYSAYGSVINVSVFEEAGELRIEVKDNGIGIPAEHLSRIFERFYRVDKSRSREAGGTGLGLSIVRHIALLHNGTAEVESHAGEGSLFRLRLPSGS